MKLQSQSVQSRAVKSNVILLWVHVVAFLIVMSISRQFDEVYWSTMCVGFIVAYALPLIFSRLCIRERSVRYGVLMLFSAMIMVVGICQNLTTYVLESGTFSDPGLGSTDACRDYCAAIEYLHTSVMPDVNPGYPYLLSWLFSVLGVNIFYPMLLNMSLTLGTIVYGGLLCQEAFPSENRERTMFWGSLMTVSVSSILFYGTILMKDAGVVFAMTAIGYAFMQCTKNRLRLSGVVAFLVGAVILTLLKSPMGYFVMVGSIIMLLTTCQKKNVVIGIVFTIMALAIVVGGEWTRYTAENTLFSSDHAESAGRYMFDYLPNTQRYAELLPDYYSKSVVVRLLLLPFTATAQYFPPFPWNFTRDLHMGGFYWFPHVALGWYAIGGLVIGYFVLCWLRRNDAGLSRWALWLLLSYLVIAYLSAGSVARYYLPFIPLAVPLAMHILRSVENRKLQMSIFRRYSAVYIVLLLIGLGASYWYLKM